MDSNSRALNYKYPDWHQVKFTTPWRKNMVIDASYSRLRYDDLWSPQPDVVLGTISLYETTTDAYTNAQPTYPDWDDYRDQVFASVSMFTGQHDITAEDRALVQLIRPVDPAVLAHERNPCPAHNPGGRRAISIRHCDRRSS